MITVDDELNAYTVFETLNARGLELTTTDLLKNYLFSLVRVPADLEALQRRWQALIETVEQARFPEFLRYHMLCELPQVRSQRLFKLVRERTKTTQEVFTLLDALETRAELFAAASDPNHSYWMELSEAKAFIRELNLFRVRQAMPLLFAAWESFSSEDFVRILKLVSVISFRYTVISRLNTNDLEPVYHNAAKAVIDGGAAASPSEVFERLEPIYVDDEKMHQDFALFCKKCLPVARGRNWRNTSSHGSKGISPTAIVTQIRTPARSSISCRRTRWRLGVRPLLPEEMGSVGCTASAILPFLKPRLIEPLEMQRTLTNVLRTTKARISSPRRSLK